MNGLLCIPIKLLASRKQEPPLKFRVHIWTPASIYLGQSLDMVGVPLFPEKTCEVKWKSLSRVRLFATPWTIHNIINTPLGVGEGNGAPLQYSCLENPMDGGAW